MKASDIAKFLNADLVGKDMEIKGVCTINNPQYHHLAFWKFDEPLYLSMPLDMLVLMKRGVENNETSYIQVDNPRLAHAKVMTEFFVKPEIFYPEIHYGSNCHIHLSAIIGCPGFAFEREEDGAPFYRPHIGRVIIGDNVRVGAYTVIQRGTIDDTIIGNNVKIDDQCHIGHNNIIGDNTIIAAGTVVSGTVTIGKNCWIGAGSRIMQHITIGDNVTIGLGANVIKSVPDNAVLAGFMAQPLEALRK